MNDVWLKKSGILKKYATEADGRVTKDFVWAMSTMWRDLHFQGWTTFEQHKWWVHIAVKEVRN